MNNVLSTAVLGTLLATAIVPSFAKTPPPAKHDLWIAYAPAKHKCIVSPVSPQEIIDAAMNAEHVVVDDSDRAEDADGNVTAVHLVVPDPTGGLSWNFYLFRDPAVCASFSSDQAEKHGKY